MSGIRRWAPAAICSLGIVLRAGLSAPITPELRLPLAVAVPHALDGIAGEDVVVASDEAQVAGFTDYVLRSYPLETEAAPWLTAYVGYYASQTRGRTIHSPKNCLPGAGWEALENRATTIALSGGGTAVVNRYLLQREGQRVLVLYWYQGRGRVAHDEYQVKWDLMRDAALKRRSDEALVRIVVPIVTSEDASALEAERAAGVLIPSLARALPA
jgi:EpsI family protein